MANKLEKLTECYNTCQPSERQRSLFDSAKAAKERGEDRRAIQITKRLMIGISIETHKTSPDFDQKKCDQAKSRIMQALGDIDCDVFIEMDR